MFGLAPSQSSMVIHAMFITLATFHRLMVSTEETPVGTDDGKSLHLRNPALFVLK